MTTTLDPIALIELGYQPKADPAEWLNQVATSVLPLLGPSDLFGVSYFFGPRGPSQVRAIGGSEEHQAQAMKMLGAGLGELPPEVISEVTRSMRTPGIASLVDLVGHFPGQGPDGEPQGGDPQLQDSVALTIPQDNGEVAVIANYMRERSNLEAPTRHLWQRLAIHLCAGLRTVGREQSIEAEDVEAAFSPDGSLKHAAGDGRDQDAQDVLRKAVSDMDRARTRAGRADPHSALELWRALLMGRWSLVDHFDTDGQRFILARRNDPNLPAPKALTNRERQVVFYASLGWSNGEIGYALGLADNTVSTHLMRALTKLGVESRADLVRLSSDIASAAGNTT